MVFDVRVGCLPESSGSPGKAVYRSRILRGTDRVAVKKSRRNRFFRQQLGWLGWLHRGGLRARVVSDGIRCARERTQFPKMTSEYDYRMLFGTLRRSVVAQVLLKTQLSAQRRDKVRYIDTLGKPRCC